MSHGTRTVAQETDLNDLLHSVLRAFPPKSEAGRYVGLTLYRELAKGRPVRREELATAAGLPTPEVEATLEEPGMRGQRIYDERRSLVGFGGLSVVPTNHQLTMNDVELYTWCAWDAFFIPPLLEQRATLRTACPGTGRRLEVDFHENGAELLGGQGGGDEPVVTFPAPDATECQVSVERSIACFCERVRLCASAAAAHGWDGYDADMRLLSLDDAFALGKRYMASRFPAG